AVIELDPGVAGAAHVVDQSGVAAVGPVGGVKAGRCRAEGIRGCKGDLDLVQRKQRSAAALIDDQGEVEVRLATDGDDRHGIQRYRTGEVRAGVSTAVHEHRVAERGARRVGVVAELRTGSLYPDERLKVASPGRRDLPLPENGTVDRPAGPECREVDDARHDAILERLQPRTAIPAQRAPTTTAEASARRADDGRKEAHVSPRGLIELKGRAAPRSGSKRRDSHSSRTSGRCGEQGWVSPRSHPRHVSTASGADAQARCQCDRVQSRERGFASPSLRVGWTDRPWGSGAETGLRSIADPCLELISALSNTSCPGRDADFEQAQYDRRNQGPITLSSMRALGVAKGV